MGKAGEAGYQGEFWCPRQEGAAPRLQTFFASRQCVRHPFPPYKFVTGDVGHLDYATLPPGHSLALVTRTFSGAWDEFKEMESAPRDGLGLHAWGDTDTMLAHS